MTEQALESHPPILIEKSSVERIQDTLRQRYACAFAAEHALVPHQEIGAQESGYIKNKEGCYETHSNGVARRFSVVSCQRGNLIWIFESKDLLSFTVEVRSIAGNTKSSFIYQVAEMEKLLEKHLHVADRTHALATFRAELLELPIDRLVAEYESLKLELKDSNSDGLKTARFRLIQSELSRKLDQLIESAFEENGSIGRKLFLHLLKQSLDAQEISLPLYLLAYLCVASGFTFTWKVKELTLKALDIESKLEPEHSDYQLWLTATADLACLTHKELAQKSKSQNETVKNKLVRLSKKDKSK
jgi:hypothetical protein